jgi:hypothetical protein
MNLEAIELVEAPGRAGGSKLQVAGHDPEKHRDTSIQPQRFIEETDDYVHGLQLAVLCITLCLCVFLVGLVSLTR